MLFSRSAKSAIQVMIYLADNEENGLVTEHAIQQVYDMPPNLLDDLIQKLAHNRLIRPVQGTDDGISLARPASEITTLEIVDAIEGPPPEKEMCVLGLDECSDTAPCALHNHWTHDKSLVHGILEEHTLADLCESMRIKRTELAQPLP